MEFRILSGDLKGAVTWLRVVNAWGSSTMPAAADDDDGVSRYDIITDLRM